MRVAGCNPEGKALNARGVFASPCKVSGEDGWTKMQTKGTVPRPRKDLEGAQKSEGW